MDARGFSLLELIVTLAIIGVLSSIALWSAHAWLPDFRLNDAVRQVTLDLRLTRARALAERQSRRLLFAPATESYRPQRKVGSFYQDDGAERPLPRGVDLVDCSATGKAIAFGPRGTASTFGTVTLRSSTGRQQQVIVDIVGRIRVQ